MLRVNRSFATSASKIGFIGLGMMGFPMAKNLISKVNPHSFYVYDTVPAATARFLKEHPTAKIAKSPKHLAQECDVVITMVPTPAIVKSVYLGENGVVHGAKPGTLLIDSSTIGPGAAKEVSKAMAQYPVDWIDAPVSGGFIR